MILQSALCGSMPGIFFALDGVLDTPVYLKCEALNVAASIKIKPALCMVRDLERSGRLRPGGTLIESSSGNLGVAVAMIAAEKGYRFICVTDPNASHDCVNVMRAVGSEVIVVDEKDANGGYLGSRIALIERMCKADPQMVWINQYANASNWQAHFETTAPEILAEFPRVDHLFVGTGTAGTLMGCARYFQIHSPQTRVVAVDAEGSVAFGTPAKPRRIPGIGTSRRPEILNEDLVDAVVHVPEVATIRMCREFAQRGLLLGGSTGTVLSGVRMSADTIDPHDVVVAIMPDLGFKYLDTIYNDDWLHRYYGNLLPLVRNELPLRRIA